MDDDGFYPFAPDTLSPGATGLTDVAYARLEEMIVMRRLPPGSMVSETQLAKELQMGRTPIREALQRLRQIGFVEMHTRRGTMVAPVDIVQQLDLLEVRRPLEDLVVRSAAARATAEQRAALASLGADIRAAAAAGNIGAYFEANRRIHDQETRAAHNAMLNTTMAAIHSQSRRFWFFHVERNRAFMEGADLHAAILGRIVSGDGGSAAQATVELMNFLERLTRAALDRR